MIPTAEERSEFRRNSEASFQRHQLGDVYLITAPCCGEQIQDLWDYGLPLTTGSLLECPHCRQLLKIARAKLPQLILEVCD